MTRRGLHRTWAACAVVALATAPDVGYALDTRWRSPHASASRVVPGKRASVAAAIVDAGDDDDGGGDFASFEEDGDDGDDELASFLDGDEGDTDDDGDEGDDLSSFLDDDGVGYGVDELALNYGIDDELDDEFEDEFDDEESLTVEEALVAATASRKAADAAAAASVVELGVRRSAVAAGAKRVTAAEARLGQSARAAEKFEADVMSHEIEPGEHVSHVNWVGYEFGAHPTVYKMRNL